MRYRHWTPGRPGIGYPDKLRSTEESMGPPKAAVGVGGWWPRWAPILASSPQICRYVPQPDRTFFHLLWKVRELRSGCPPHYPRPLTRTDSQDTLAHGELSLPSHQKIVKVSSQQLSIHHVSQHPERPQCGPVQGRLQQVSSQYTHPTFDTLTITITTTTVVSNRPPPHVATTRKMAPSCVTSTPAAPLPRRCRLPWAPMAATRSSSTISRR